MNSRGGLFESFLLTRAKLFVFKWQEDGGFPGGSVVKNPPASAGDVSSIPDPGRPHVPRSNGVGAPQQLSLRSRAWVLQPLKPVCLRAHALQQEPSSQ